MKKIAIYLTFIMICLTGCGTADNMDTNQSKSQQANAKSGSDQAVLNEFNDLLFGKEADGQAIASFIKNNANVVSEQASSQMILQFEEFQKNKLTIFESEFNTGSVQKELMEQYLKGADINNPDGFHTPDVKALIEETKNCGYKIVQTDGACYPVIDYNFYKTFGENVTPEVLEYIHILSIESENPPLRNAALAIGLDELISRAIRQERFLNAYSGSNTAENILNLYQSYEQIIFFGSDNSPIFEPDSGALKSDVKSAFEKAIESNTESALTNKIKQYLSILEENGFLYTAEVEQFQEKIKP